MSDAVRQIKERLNIIDVVSPYVELHKAGRNFKGKSPFTNEKTPSFYVSPERGMYYCFSTSQGGDIFSFIQTMEGVDFREALRQLAEKAGVELVAEAPEKRSERDRLYALIEETTKFFEEWLPLAPIATAYLEKRAVKPATVSKWRIGYAPGPSSGGWRLLKEYLAAKGYSVPEMLKAGVVKPGADGKEPFDVFRDRVMFPLRDPNGKVVGFSGRTLTPDEKTPKYVNSPETELYKKSELLFGYDLAKQSIRTLDFFLIVEGQFDVVMSHQAGYGNTVAVSGTALTLHHVQLLERLSTRVVLALDADRAGIAAMKRAAEVMLRRGLDVKVAKLPPGADPADLVEKDPHALKSAVGGAVPIIDFLLVHLKEQVTDERAFRLRVSEEVIPYVTLIPNRIDQEHFVGIVAAALGVSLDSVRFEVERARSENERTPERVSAHPIPQVAVPATVDTARLRSEQRERFLSWLVAAVSLLDGSLAMRVSKALEEITDAPLAEVQATVTADMLAHATIDIGNRYASRSEKAFLEDIVSNLNLTRSLIIREAIAERKQLLKQLEAGKEGDLTSLLADLTTLESKRKLPAYGIESFTV
ncbi:DNA primase [Patescibacteria group bacterium]|nr:DNA primase [Patescibacteria group bacterium]